MYLYKDGMTCYADKDQIEHMLADGWSKVNPENEVNPEPAETDEATDESTGEVVDDEVVDDEVVDDETPESGEASENEVDAGTDSANSQSTGRKIVRKTTKK